jgi:hypothetical protein
LNFLVGCGAGRIDGEGSLELSEGGLKSAAAASCAAHLDVHLTGFQAALEGTTAILCVCRIGLRLFLIKVQSGIWILQAQLLAGILWGRSTVRAGYCKERYSENHCGDCSRAKNAHTLNPVAIGHHTSLRGLRPTR